MKEWGRRWKGLWFLRDKNDPEPFVILEYRAPPGTQTIDNSEEFERVRRCVAEGKDPFEGRYSYTGWGMKRKHLPRTVPILEYRAPPGTQTIDNSEEFERVRRCAEQGILPYARPRPSFWRSLRRSEGSRAKAVPHQHLDESDGPSADEHRR